MKNWYLLHYSKALFGLLLLMVIAINSALFFGNSLILSLVLFLAVPIFTTFYFLKFNPLNWPIVGFLLFTFLGNAFSSIYLDVKHASVSNIMYLLGLSCLIFVVLPKCKLQEVQKWVRNYLVVVFAIALYFWFEISRVFSALVYNDLEFYVFVLQSLILVVLGFLSFAMCLNTKNQSKSATSFLAGIIAFGFALAINYISSYYVYDWVFEPLNALFYVTGLYFIFRFMLDETKTKKPIEECEVFYSEIVFA